VFEKELELIVNPTIRDFTEKCIALAPDYFWSIPSSSSGKYHPADEIGEGGEYLHSRRVVRVADDLCRNFSVVGDRRDCILSASIQHDFCKNGYPNNLGYTVDGHGALWVLIMSQVMRSSAALYCEYVKLISRLICVHMGRWDFPFIAENSDILAYIIKTADYIASRRYISVNPL